LPGPGVPPGALPSWRSFEVIAKHSAEFSVRAWLTGNERGLVLRQPPVEREHAFARALRLRTLLPEIYDPLCLFLGFHAPLIVVAHDAFSRIRPQPRSPYWLRPFPFRDGRD